MILLIFTMLTTLTRLNGLTILASKSLQSRNSF